MALDNSLPPFIPNGDFEKRRGVEADRDEGRSVGFGAVGDVESLEIMARVLAGSCRICVTR